MSPATTSRLKLEQPLTGDGVLELRTAIAQHATVLDEAVVRSEAPLNVTDYGAKGDFTGDQHDAFNSALAAAGNAIVGGGRVIAPRGDYRFLTALSFPTDKAVTLEGEGEGTYLDFFDAAIAQGSPGIILGSAAAKQRLKDVRVYGPASSALGVDPACMDGIKANRYAELENVHVNNFRSNIVIAGDHQKFNRAQSRQGYYNAYYGSGAVTFGDQEFVQCELDSPTFASIAVHPSNKIDGASLHGVHLGFGPYGFYREAGAQSTWINNTLFSDVCFESCGNGAFFDEGSSGTPSGDIVGLTFVSVVEANAYDATYKLGGRAADASFIARTIQDSAWLSSPSIGGAVGAVSIIKTPSGVSNLFWPDDSTARAAALAAGKPVFSGAVSSALRFVTGAATAATTPGSVVKKLQVFDASGTSLGYVPIYSAIT